MDQVTPELSLDPLTAAVKDTVWPEVREMDEGVREIELGLVLEDTASAPVAPPGISVMIALPFKSEPALAISTTVSGARMTLGAT